ncbi:MAG TPA: cobalamin-binding protein [Spirochaetia bacterium]|nr:cobalamin-binding protein [Spirochaetales bacterium]HRW24421.1 cobalamin-binding protein [Spirochaetia bacterium]
MKRAALSLCALAIAVAAAAAGPVSFVDERGVTISLPGKARRVVSLSPELTESLFAAGAGDAVVGVTTYCNYPAEASGRAKIGGFSAKTISVETIIALKPDLVVGGLSAHGQLATQFERAGLRFAALPTTDFDDIYATIALLGRVAGDEAVANALVADLKARLAAVSAKIAAVPSAERPLVFWETWDEPLMSAGPGTFTGQIIEAAGGRNCFADAASDWPVVSFEALLARDPDYIMAADSHGEALTPERLAKRSGWSSLRAVRNGRLVFLDGDIVSRAGPRFVEAVELMARALYPESYGR